MRIFALHVLTTFVLPMSLLALDGCGAVCNPQRTNQCSVKVSCCSCSEVACTNDPSILLRHATCSGSLSVVLPMAFWWLMSPGSSQVHWMRLAHAFHAASKAPYRRAVVTAIASHNCCKQCLFSKSVWLMQSICNSPSAESKVALVCRRSGSAMPSQRRAGALMRCGV